MATNILMPALSPTMTEGNLAKWVKKEGDRVKAGDVLAEIETDKATMEVEAVDEGILARILVPAGTQGVKVNAPIAVLTEEGEAVSAAAAPAAAPAAAAPAAAPPPAAPPAPAAASAPAAAPAPAASGERVIASPLARRMAEQAGLDLRAVRGSGPNGRIVRADVEAALGKGAPRAAAAPAAAVAAPAPVASPVAVPTPAGAPAAPHEVQPLSTMRKVIARRLSESKASIPHFYLVVDIELDALLKLRAELNAKSPAEGKPGAYKVSVNDFIIKASAMALRKVPAANASFGGDVVYQYADVDVSVAVATPGGLITPIVRKADQKGLATISNEMKDLAARARGGKLKPEEFQGGGFSISNLGMFGVKEFYAIINPPQAAILSVGAGEQRPVVKGGALAIATVMTCGLSVDHRVVDGAIGAEWMAAFKGFIEDPLSLLL